MVDRSVTVKRKVGNTWQSTTEDISALNRYKGQEVVAKISDAVMWCGTEQWRQHYIEKGYAATNDSDLIAVCELAKEIFRCNREERIAIMVEDGGCTEAEANDHCNMQPDLYGLESEKASG